LKKRVETMNRHPSELPLSGTPFDIEPSASATDQAISTIVRAFEADTAVRWMFPDRETYAEYFPQFVRALSGPAFDEGTVGLLDGAAAIWLKPGSEPDEEKIAEIVERSVPEHRHPESFALFEEMGGHHPAEPHWYLPLLGVEPGLQGKGLGTALMQPILDLCDASGLPAYLEASAERNRDLYARLGFETIATIRVADCRPIFPMLRRPR
jgi:GNAT superfamily N-acetyltransferase